MKAYTKDISKTIVKGKKRFFALMLIAALGVCMMSGLKASCDDLRLTADAFFDKQNLFDITVVSTMGLTGEDVEVLSRIDGVEAVEGTYSEKVFTKVDGQTKQALMQVLSQKEINVPYLLEGEMPLRSDEILVTQKYLADTGKKVGDVIEIEEKMDDEEDSKQEDSQEGAENADEGLEDDAGTNSKDLSEGQENADSDNEGEGSDTGNEDASRAGLMDESDFALNLEQESETEESEAESAWDEKEIEMEVEEEEEEPNFLVTSYTIVGVVIDARDINSQEGAVSFRSNSSTNYTFFVLPEAVDTDIFTAIYMTLDGTDELQCYSDDYEAAVDEIVTILEEEVKLDREQARYDEITGEALEKVDEAELEMYDAFAEVEAEIYDAKVEIENGWSELLDGEAELLNGEAELAEAEQMLQKAQRELEQGEKELEDAEAQLETAWEELESGERLLQVGEIALETMETALNESEKALIAAETELTKAEAELDEAEAKIPSQFDTMRTVLNGQVSNAKTDIQEVETEVREIEAEIAELEAQKAPLAEKEANGSITDMEKLQLDSLNMQLNFKYPQLELRRGELTSLQNTLVSYEQSLADLNRQEADAYAEISKDREELEIRKAELADSRAELEQKKQELAGSRAELEQNKQMLVDGRAELEQAQADFDKGKQEITDGWTELDAAWEELEAARAELESGRGELESGRAEFEDGKQKYEENVSAYMDKREEAFDKIAEARQEITELKMTEWYISTRTSLNGYANIKTDAQCIESIGNAFPILFMTVAILISLTTISRMVEEDRGLIGTYKALGFTDKEIRRKYVVYALLACVFGGILGDFLGFIVLPEVIFTVFGVMYQLPEYMLSFNWLYGIGGILLFMLGIVGAAVVSCSSELAIMPAMLMRPKAPKNGSRVLLERITPVWSRLSFLNKVTARNLFRYKKRLFMTLFGIAGCTSILLAGFTIKDTITAMMPLQYETTYTYDVMVVSDDNEQLLEYLDDTDVHDFINPMITNVKIINDDGREESLQLTVLPDGVSLTEYVNLVDEDNKQVELEDGMVASTINVSEVLGFEKGDTITIQNMNLENADVEVTDIVMNYLGNSIYMTEGTYRNIFDDYEANGAFVMLDKSVKDQEAYAEELAQKDHIFSAISIEGFQSNFDNVFRIINLVVTIVITLAAALAFVVLFTLSTTNISERERELATIKVLGFFDREVHSYVNKETLILTSLGILLGMPLGKFFGIWLMSILKMPSIYFADYLYPISYVYAAIITTIFALIVNKITDKSLDKINPVEALKSIE